MMLVTIHVYHCRDSLTFSFDSRMFISHIKLIIYKNDSFDTGVTAVVLFLSKIGGKSDQPFPLIDTYLFINQFLFVLYNLAAGACSDDVIKRAAPYNIKYCSDATVHSVPGDAIIV